MTKTILFVNISNIGYRILNKSFTVSSIEYGNENVKYSPKVQYLILSFKQFEKYMSCTVTMYLKVKLKQQWKP